MEARVRGRGRGRKNVPFEGYYFRKYYYYEGLFPKVF